MKMLMLMILSMGRIHGNEKETRDRFIVPSFNCSKMKETKQIVVT